MKQTGLISFSKTRETLGPSRCNSLPDSGMSRDMHLSACVSGQAGGP